MTEASQKEPDRRRALRSAFGTFATGVTVVTTRVRNETTADTYVPVGFTANSFTSVSLDPALLLVCVDKTSSTLKHFVEADSFAVNILASDQSAVSRRFASRTDDRFAGVSWHPGGRGDPLIDGCAAWFDCTLHQMVDAGDHVVLIGRVADFGKTGKPPLIFQGGQYLTPFSLAEAARTSESIRVGGLLRFSERVLLERQGEEWTLPMGLPCAGVRLARSDLEARLVRRGITVKWDVPYSVFDAPETAPGVWMFFLGMFVPKGALGEDFRLFAPGSIPFAQISARPVRAMLLRYCQECRDGRFGLYADGTGRCGGISHLAEAAFPGESAMQRQDMIP